MIHPPIVVFPTEEKHPAIGRNWALACIKTNAGECAETDPYGRDEVGIGEDSVWFGRYLVALARLTPEGRCKVDAARGSQEEIALDIRKHEVARD